MSIRIALDDQPEFYTNLDFVSGRVLLALNRTEQIGNIVVKLEGESATALQVPKNYSNESGRPAPGPAGGIVSEKHKILYKVQQVFPDDYYASSSNPYGAYPLQPGHHEFPFKFKIPINNACSDPMAMAQMGGIGGVGGFTAGGGLFGMGGVRVMDGTKQLYLRHVTATLPPSLTGYPMEAEIRYYVKVTIQRPGFLKENWRFQVGFKFLPIEPPRPPLNGQEAFARRPFTFRPRTPNQPQRKRSTFFAKKGKDDQGTDSASSLESGETAPTPSVELSARLPHPTILTCNQSVPLRVISKKLVNNHEPVYLVSFQMDLIGVTEVRSHGIFNRKINRWTIVSDSNLNILLQSTSSDRVGSEFVLPDGIWKDRALPNTVAPSFSACNLTRRYELELKLGVSWGKPRTSLSSNDPFYQPQTIFLPLHFAQVTVYSGIAPPNELLEAARNTRPGPEILSIPPRLPPRTSLSGSNTPITPTTPIQPSPMPPRPPQDPLYPPQLAPGQMAPAYDEAPPPSYDEAIAENLTGPFDGLRPRPAYSGVTNENAPSQMPEGKQ